METFETKKTTRSISKKARPSTKQEPLDALEITISIFSFILLGIIATALGNLFFEIINMRTKNKLRIYSLDEVKNKFIGKIMGAHGKNGTVRVKFAHGVPGQAIGARVALS